MEYGIKKHEFLEYGELNSNLYGIKLDSVRAIIGNYYVVVQFDLNFKIVENFFF